LPMERELCLTLQRLEQLRGRKHIPQKEGRKDETQRSQ